MSSVDLSSLTVSDVFDENARDPTEGLSDSSLIAAVAAVIGRPKEAPADSFILHAPLELLARAELLCRVSPQDRAAGRRRMAWLAATYNEAGPELATPAPGTWDSPGEAATALVSALEAGDLDDIDRASAAVAHLASPLELRRLLAGPIAASLAAAAHGSIFLSLLPRVDNQRDNAGVMLRGIARDLGRHPDWKLRWFDDPGSVGIGSALDAALLEVPMLGPAGNNFIMPVMRQAEDSGIAARLLSGVVDGRPIDVALVRAQLSRVAAWSMLQEPGGHAYGWSHCLTMPQAVLAVADEPLDQRAAVAIAATHVVGFRAALGARALEPSYAPQEPDVGSLEDALVAGPHVAAAFAFFAGDDRAREVACELAGRAVRHHDAHYAKYTLACFDAADADPDEAALYSAAAAFLAGYWSANGDDGLIEGPCRHR